MRLWTHAIDNDHTSRARKGFVWARDAAGARDLVSQSEAIGYELPPDAAVAQGPGVLNLPDRWQITSRGRTPPGGH